MSRMIIGLLAAGTVLAFCTAAVLIWVGALLLSRPDALIGSLRVLASVACISIGGLIALLLVVAAGIWIYTMISGRKNESKRRLRS